LRIGGVEFYAKSMPKPSSPEGREELLLDHHLLLTLRALDRTLGAASKYDGFAGKLAEPEIQKAAFAAALLHDLGKVDFGFQERIYGEIYAGDELKAARARLRELFVGLGPMNFVEGHEVLSYAYNRMIFYLVHDHPAARLLTLSALPVLHHHYNSYYALTSLGG